MGPLLGLGSEGKWRSADRALVRDHFARALGRIHPATRADDHGYLRQCRHQLLVVRREHARGRPAFIRLHAKGIPVARRLHGQSICVDVRGSNAA